MQVVQSGGQICNEFNWVHLVAKFAIKAMLLPNLIEVRESISGSVVFLAMFAQKRCIIAMESENHHLNFLRSPKHELK